MMVSVNTETDAGKLRINFPVKMVSTNVSALKDELFSQLIPHAHAKPPFKGVELMFDQTLMIDSLGLNLLVSVLEWADKQRLPVEAYIRQDIVFNTLESVWLTQKMKVHRIK